jgi:PAS domain S-box-containing protein
MVRDGNHASLAETGVLCCPADGCSRQPPLTGQELKKLVIEGRNLEWLLTAATDAMLIADRDGRIVLANPALLRLFGYTEEALLGQPVEILVPAHLEQRHTGHRAAYFDHPRARAMGAGSSLLARHSDGREFPVEVSLSPLGDVEATPLALAIIYDITARKQAEAALQESEARMRAIFETAVDAIITIDERGMMERLNPAAQCLFGYTEAEVSGQNVSLLMPAPHRARHDGYLAHYRETGERRIIGVGREVEGLRKDGSTFPMELAVTEMYLGERRMFTGMVRDISERKRAEQALRQTQHDLRKLAAHQEGIREDERKRIAQEVHDELGGLLTGIKAYIGVAIERAGSDADPLLAEASGLAQDAITTVRRIITDLRPSVLDQLGLWAALEWQVEQATQRAGLRSVCSIAPEAGSLELDDARCIMLFRVVQEALTNVVRHARASRVTLDADCRDGCLLLAVIDDGCGIAMERLQNRESWGIIGMQERVRHFGGELRIAPGELQGTVLRLRLPLESQV